MERCRRRATILSDDESFKWLSGCISNGEGAFALSESEALENLRGPLH